jgi:hypothetical protein
MRSLFCTGVIVAALLAVDTSLPASAQTHYETGGRVQEQDPLAGDDGFRPVWQQQRDETRQRDSRSTSKRQSDQNKAKTRSTNPAQGKTAE